jgi:putative phosphoesterase
MKIAIIADIHANYEALQAIPEAYDELWVLGDLVNFGPEPGAVVDFVKEHAALVVRGNHDQAIGFNDDPRCVGRYRAMAKATGKYTASVLNPEQKEFLRGLPLQVEITRGNTRFYLCHAKPSDPLFGYLRQDSGEWVEEIRDLHADAVLVGHTHTPFIREIGERVLLNPGSMGQPKTGNSNACYATWEDGQFELKDYGYAVHKTVAKIRNLSFPDAVEENLVRAIEMGL